jgi:hypothetical protein
MRLNAIVFVRWCGLIFLMILAVSAVAMTALAASARPDESGSGAPGSNGQSGHLDATEVLAPATLYVWPGDLFLDSLDCQYWTAPQIPDSLERNTLLTIAACADTSNHNLVGVYFHIKRASDSPLVAGNWDLLGDDSTAPYFLHGVNLWAPGGTLLSGGGLALDMVPRAGVAYDLVARTTDNEGQVLTWAQFVAHGSGTTWQEQWADLIAQHHVTRFMAVDHVAPVAHSFYAGPDQTPDSSVTFLTGNVMLRALVDDADRAAVIFAVRSAGSGGAWTTVETVLASPSSDTFRLADNALWNTQLLNGAYTLGAFARDSADNVDGDLSGAGPGPANPLTVFIDNERPTADAAARRRNGAGPVGTRLALPLPSGRQRQLRLATGGLVLSPVRRESVGLDADGFLVHVALRGGVGDPPAVRRGMAL